MPGKIAIYPGSHLLQFNNLKKKKKKNPISLQSLSGKALWQFCLSQNGHISTLSQNVRPRGWVTLLDQPGTGGSNDLQAHRGHLEGKRWEGRENYKGGGRRRRKRRKTTEAQIPFSTRLSAFSFCIRHLLIQLVPTEHQGLKFLDVPNICNDDSSVNNTPLLDYELQFPREIFLFPLLWPDIQLRTIN